MKRQKKLNKYTQADLIAKRGNMYTNSKINPKVAKLLQAAAFTSMMASAAGGTPYMNVDPNSDLGKAIKEIDASDGDDT